MSNSKKIIPSILALLLVTFLNHQSLAQIADKVFKNAKIYTTNNSFEEAIAIKDGNIIYVGTDAAVNAHIGAGTAVEDLDGKLILPGLHDVHMHPLEASSPLGGGCVLDSSEEDPRNFVSFIQNNCDLTPNANGWIVGFGHSIFTFFDPQVPDPENIPYPKTLLDQAINNPNIPAVIMEETSHSVWVNSKALELIGITNTTPANDPVGGHIVRDGNIPTGILLDNAGDIALSLALVSNANTDAENKAGLVEYGLPFLAENGITSICEGRTYWKRNYIEIWESIKADGDLTCRVALAPWVYPSDSDATLIPALQNLFDEGDDMLSVGQIKVYSDGIMVNATAAMLQPYDYSWDLPITDGLNYVDETRLTDLITDLELEGYDFHIHAIGDRGIHEALNAIEAARNINGNIGARHRITHLEIVNANDYPRFAALNVTADVQVAGDFTQPANWGENSFLIGNRADNLMPIKSLKNAGARITLSSDWDVSDANPFLGIQNALTRSPQELSSVEDAVKAYTIDAAYVMRHENETGSLEVGKWADLVIVNKDIFTIPTNQISTTKVLLTMLGGEEVYRSPTLLPVELVYFEVKKAGCAINLEWVTASENNNDKFLIEHSKNGKSYQVIGEVSGQSNRSEKTTYHFVDKNPHHLNYYRLRQIDFDGVEDLSPVVTSRKACEEELEVQLSPNVTNYLTMIKLTGGQNDTVQGQLLSVQGQVIKTFEIKHHHKVSQSPLNVTFLPEGIYYVRIISNKNEYLATQTLVVTR